jgi:hypothetical protein
MLSGFQYRAALAATKITVNELGALIGLHPITLLRYKKTPNQIPVSRRVKNTLLLQDFFERRSVLFPATNSVKLKTDFTSKNITRFHLVVARIATGLNQHQLSSILRISPSTLSILENLNNMEVINTRTLKNSNLIRFFEHVGITLNDDYSVSINKDPEKFIEKAKMLVDTKRKDI